MSENEWNHKFDVMDFEERKLLRRKNVARRRRRKD